MHGMASSCASAAFVVGHVEGLTHAMWRTFVVGPRERSRRDLAFRMALAFRMF